MAVSNNSGKLMSDLIKIFGATAVLLIVLQMTGVIKLYTPSRGNKNNQQPQILQ